MYFRVFLKVNVSNTFLGLVKLKIFFGVRLLFLIFGGGG